MDMMHLRKDECLKLMKKADSTLRTSQAVPHPSTIRALCHLTSEVERDPVHLTWYGRQRKYFFKFFCVLFAHASTSVKILTLLPGNREVPGSIPRPCIWR